MVLAPIPSNISAAAGGLLFGTWPAFFLTAAAVLLGSVLVFLMARALGRQFADRFVSAHVTGRYLELIRTKTDTVLAITFLFPFFPDDLICILAGLTSIPLRRFVVIVVLTRPWGLLVASAVGGASLDLPVYAMVLLAAAGVAVFVWGVKYGDRIEQRILTWLKRR